MKNLKLYSEMSLSLELHHQDEVILFSAFDTDRNRLFFASSANFIYTAQLSSFQIDDAVRKASLSAECDAIDLEPGDRITSFDYLLEKEALIFGTSAGLIFLYSLDDKATEVVGRVEGGIKCISLSPDGELLAIISGFGQLLVMTHDWDLLHEATLEDLPEDVDVHESVFPSSDKFEGSASWRGDGKYFATLCESLVSSSHQKRLKVWERDSLTLHATSESKALVGTVLEWMPSGAKIAVAYNRKMENKCPSLAFFEKNGLERGSFSINDLEDTSIDSIRWNCSSDLLAVIVRGGNYDSVKIWYCSNNHWYLKHEIRYSSEDDVQLMWHPTKPFQLICWTHGARSTVYDFIWITAVMENSTAFVIDDSKILVTPLSISLLPPPMYLFSLRFPGAVREFAFYSKNSKNLLAALLSNGCLSVVELPEIATWEDLEGKEYNLEVCPSETLLGSFVHLIWLDLDILLVVSHYNTDQKLHGKEGLCGYYLQEFELVCSENHIPGLITCSGWHATIANQIPLEKPPIAITPNAAKKSSAFIQFDGGKIFEYNSHSRVAGGILKQYCTSFLSHCPWMSAASFGGGSPNPMPFGLDDIGQLQYDGKVFCNNCSSFSFYSNRTDLIATHLILATKQDLLFVVEIDDMMHGEVNAKYENFVNVGNKRRGEENSKFIHIWERGAKVIGVLHGDEAAVILQTTRGNLECIYPRKLVLASIVNALAQHRFKDALLMVRRHRIDFNIIVDHCGWKAFVECAPEFVKQIQNLNYLTEFVFALKKENITESLYKNYISLHGFKMVKDVEVGISNSYYPSNKVSSVLLAIRRSIIEQVPESPARELCILTTLAHSDPPALEEALERIKTIREAELLGSNDPRRMSYPSAEEALKHLLWLSDPEAVYQAALGLYDLNLAAMVALNSQRDPKEFLPFLDNLRRMPAPLMQYNIDLKLHKYENALKHVASAGDAHYDDFMDLMKTHPHLFPKGLQLVTDPTKRSQVLEAWGDHLSDSKCFEDAATTYLCCSNLKKALKAYRSCGNWCGVLTVGGLLKMGKEDIVQIAHELCEELQALGKPREAAKIALEYCEDVKYGTSLLVSAREWEEALRIALMHMKEDLVSEIKSASLECANNSVGEYEEALEKVGKYAARYLAVRQRRLLLAAKLQSEEQTLDTFDDDTASETSTNFSGISAYTTGTRMGSSASMSTAAGSKARESRRRRKGGKIRPGSPGEELALVDHLNSMSLSVGAMHELRSLLVCLITLGEREIAARLQRTVENFQLSQIAAVKLAEDTMAIDAVNEQVYTLENYLRKTRVEMQDSEVFSWRHKVFISPS